jgi:hypothetical protein
LRHPSISQRQTNQETRSKRYGVFSSMQCLSSFVHQHRAESTTVPVVIVTPSSPKRIVTELLSPPPSSSLELTHATVEPESLHLTRGTGEVSLTSEKQASVPPDVEPDIEFDSWTISVPQEPSEPSFYLPESLGKITFEPIHCASHALSAVSDMFYDVPACNTAEALVPLFFTSTPPKRCRSTGTKLPDIENNNVQAIDILEPPSHDIFCQYVDLIPYPDVFDLDMYHDTTKPLRKKLTKLYNRDCTFENVHSLQSDGLTGPPQCETLPSDDCKGKYGMATSTVTLVSSPIADFEACRDNIPASPSLLKYQEHRIPPRISFIHTPLHESTNISFKTSATTSSSSVYSSPAKSRPQIRSLPASAHDQSHQQSRTFAYLDSDSDIGSMDALRARLREACDSSITTHAEVEIWDPVSF